MSWLRKGRSEGPRAVAFVEEVEAPDGDLMTFEGATEAEARAKADEFMRWAWGDEPAT